MVNLIIHEISHNLNHNIPSDLYHKISFYLETINKLPNNCESNAKRVHQTLGETKNIAKHYT